MVTQFRSPWRSHPAPAISFVLQRQHRNTDRKSCSQDPNRLQLYYVLQVTKTQRQDLDNNFCSHVLQRRITIRHQDTGVLKELCVTIECNTKRSQGRPERGPERVTSLCNTKSRSWRRQLQRICVTGIVTQS